MRLTQSYEQVCMPSDETKSLLLAIPFDVFQAKDIGIEVGECVCSCRVLSKSQVESLGCPVRMFDRQSVHTSRGKMKEYWYLDRKSMSLGAPTKFALAASTLGGDKSTGSDFGSDPESDVDYDCVPITGCNGNGSEFALNLADVGDFATAQQLSNDEAPY